MKRLDSALSARTSPIDMFFRDDDAGWHMDALDAMLDCFAAATCPVDLAVIPAVLDDQAARRLQHWQAQHQGVGCHQHGYAHVNYEAATARKCEFGPARPVERQCADILIGRERLADMIGVVDPIFTPPWNRCVPETVARMRDIGFRGYSADHAVTGAADAISMIPVSLDWDRVRREDRLFDALADACAAPHIRVGIMLHHATLGADDRALLSDVLALVSDHPAVRLRSMRYFLEF